MTFHLWLTGNSFLGTNILVDLFFLLSGFVLAPQLRVNSKSSARRFILNRILRLWPMLVPVFMTMIVIGRLPILHGHLKSISYSYIQYGGAFLLLQIFISGVISMNTPLWSLSAEWFVNLLAIRLAPRGNRLFALVLVGYLIELLGLVLDSRYHLGWGFIQYLVAIGRVIVGFYLGIYLRDAFTNHQLKVSKLKMLLALSLFALIYYLVQFSNFYIVFAAPVFYILLSQVVMIDESRVPNSILRISSYIGRISYGIYVWHLVIAHLAIPDFLIKRLPRELPNLAKSSIRVLGTIALVVVATEFSIRLVETPLRNWGRRRLRSSSR